MRWKCSLIQSIDINISIRMTCVEALYLLDLVLLILLIRFCCLHCYYYIDESQTKLNEGGAQHAVDPSQSQLHPLDWHFRWYY